MRGVLLLFGVRIDPDSHILAVREEIAGALQLGHSEGVVEKEDRDRILGALDLAERMVEEIMLHRSGIEMIDATHAPGFGLVALVALFFFRQQAKPLIACGRPVRKARRIASFWASSTNQRNEKPVIGKLPNWLALKLNSTTTITGRNMKA